MNLPVLAKSLFDDFNERYARTQNQARDIVHETTQWAVPQVRSMFTTIAEMFLAARCTHDDLRVEAERMLRFVANLSLADSTIADYRERRERVHAMQRVLRAK